MDGKPFTHLLDVCLGHLANTIHRERLESNKLRHRKWGLPVWHLRLVVTQLGERESRDQPMQEGKRH
jgi:hypothetical protein